MRAAASLLLLLAACGGPGEILVRVDATTPVGDIVELRGAITLGGATTPFSVRPAGPISIPPQQSFLLQLPEGATGVFDLTIDAVDLGSAVAANGDAQADVGDGKITVVVGTAAPPDLAAPVDLAPAPDLSSADGGFPPCANVLLVVDRTGSTSTTFAGTTELKGERAALERIADEHAWRAPVGLATLGAVSAACTDGIAIAPSPAVGAGPAIHAALDKLTATGLGNIDYLLRTIESDQAFVAARSPVVMLVTDGSADCPSAANATAIAAAVTAAQALVASGVRIVVIGLMVPGISGLATNPASAAGLDQIAAAGGAPCTSGCGGHAFYPVTDASATFAESLHTQLEALIDPLVRACH